MSLTDSIQQDRHIVVAIGRRPGTVRVKGFADACTDLSCSRADARRQRRTKGGRGDLTRRLKRGPTGQSSGSEGPVGRPVRIVVVPTGLGRALSSPEW